MVKITKIILVGIIVIAFHLYVGGSGISAVMTANNANWLNGELKPALSKWEKDYFNPVDTYKRVINPITDFEKKVSQRTWYSLPITMILLFLFIFGWSWRKKNYKDASEYGSHGTARWATRSEIFRKGDITGNSINEIESAGVILGYEEKWYGKGRYITIPPDSELNQNIIVYGGSGVGKDFTYIKTQIFQTMVPFEPKGKRGKKANDRYIPRDYSLFVIDPKGECYRDTAATLMDEGYEVYSFNLVNMKSSHRSNAMDYVKDDIDANRLASLIIANSKDGHGGGDPFWAQAETALMSALILFVKYETEPKQQNLTNVLHIGTTYNNEDELDILFDSLPYNHPALAVYKIFKLAPPDTRSGILIGFGAQLLLFANRQIAELTSQSDFRLDDMGRRKIALFLIIPDGENTFKDLTSLFITQAFQQWWKVANENNGTCPVGIRVLGNEWANIGRVPMLAERTSVMRSKGVSVQLVLQAKSQLVKLYDKDADIIIQNCDTTIFLGTNDTPTAEQMEKDLGEMTIEVQTVAKQEGGMIAVNPNVTTQHQSRKLRTANEIKRNSRKKNIIIQNASYPFETLKTPFIKHPLAKDFVKLDPNTVIPPKHRGYEVFSRSDYDKMLGLVIEPVNVTSKEVSDNFSQQTQQIKGLDILEDMYGNSYEVLDVEDELDTNDVSHTDKEERDESVALPETAADPETVEHEKFVDPLDTVNPDSEQHEPPESALMQNVLIDPIDSLVLSELSVGLQEPSPEKHIKECESPEEVIQAILKMDEDEDLLKSEEEDLKPSDNEEKPVVDENEGIDEENDISSFIKRFKK